MIAAKAKEPGKAKTEAPAQQRKQAPASPQAPAFNPLWQQVALGVQAKLAVSAPDDPLEREADAVADRVMRMAEPSVQRKCAACEEEEKLQRKESRSTPDTTATISPVVHEVLSTPGQPLDSATREFFEPRFGNDFGGVRVHSGSLATEAARGIQARAFTLGPHIVFGSGQYAPTMPEGGRLLAHELAHVVQQSGGSGTTSFQPQRMAYGKQEPQRIPLVGDTASQDLSVSAAPATTLFRSPDDTAPAQAAAPPPAASAENPAESLYDRVLHLWNLRTGYGEALNPTEEALLRNEDLAARLMEKACAPDSSDTQWLETMGLPTSPGLAEESLPALVGTVPKDEFVFELFPADDDEIQLARAYAERVVLQLVHTKPPGFKDEGDFWDFHQDVTGYACSETQTLGQIGEEYLNKLTWAFPRTWAQRLKTSFIPDLNLVALQNFRNQSYEALNKAAAEIPPYLAANGLPIGFKESLSLDYLSSRELIEILRSHVATEKFLDAFFKAEDESLENDLKWNFARRWLQWGEEIVTAVGTAHKNVDYPSTTGYWQKISVESLISNLKKTGEFDANHLRLNLLEMDISYMAYAPLNFKKWEQKQILDGVLDQQFKNADGLIAALDDEKRLNRAQEWRSAKDFDSKARDLLIESFDLGDMAKSVGKDILLNIGIGLLTGGWGVLAKEVGQAAYGLGESAYKIDEARDAARHAKTVAGLQKASANLAVVMASEGLNIALTLAQIPGLVKQAKHLRGSVGKALVPKDEPLPSGKAPHGEPPPKVQTGTAADTKTPSITPGKSLSIAEPPPLKGKVFEGITKDTEGLLEKRPGMRKILEEHPDAAGFFKLCKSFCFPDFLTDEELSLRLKRLENIMKEAEKSGIELNQASIQKLLHKQDSVKGIDAALNQIEDQLKDKIRGIYMPGHSQAAQQTAYGSGDLGDPSSIAKTPGGQRMRDIEAGNLVHYKKGELRYAEALRERLGRAPIPAQFAQNITTGQIITLDKMPDNLLAEVRLGSTVRSDRMTNIRIVNDAKGIIYEIKPNTESGISKGLEQVGEYVNLQNKKGFGGRNDWRGVVVVYNAVEAKKFIPK